MFQLPLVAILAAALLPQAAPIDVSQTSSGSFGFDWPGTVGSEAPVMEFHYEPAAGDATAKHRDVRITQAAVIGENQVTMKLSLLGVEPGVYDLTVRLLGPGGAPSGYSDLLAVKVRVVPPQTPTGLRVVGSN